MDQKEVIDKVRRYKTEVEKHFSIENVYLFGSFARGNSNEDSDIDVAIIVKEIKDDFFSVNPLLWKLRSEIDLRIEPVLIEKDNDVSGFYESVIEDGIEIF